MQTNQIETIATEKTEKKSKRRIGLIAIGFGVMGTGGILASAASLGTSAAGSLATGVQIVSACDNDGVNLEYTNDFSATTGKYEITGVNITGIALACYGKTLKITLRSGTVAPYTVLASASRGLEDTYTVGGSDFTGKTALEFPTAFDSAQFDTAAIVIA
jgi:hypothetical protein